MDGLPAREPLRALDISSLARAVGTPTGMLRVERELVDYALRHDPSAVPVFFDEVSAAFCPVRAERVRDVVAWDGNLQRLAPRDAAPRTGWRRLVPSRGPLIAALERRRVASRAPAARWLFDRLQRACLGLRGAPIRLDDGRGRRLALIPFEEAIGPPVAFRPGDTLFSASSDWDSKDPSVLAALAAAGVRLCVLCYDIFPITQPQFFRAGEIARFRDHWTVAFAAADTVIVNARSTEAEVRGFCGEAGIRVGTIAVVPLGCDVPRPAPARRAPLPAGLVPGRFVLYVSTIEPRKNHALLLRVWRRLLDRGVPQRTGFRLVFAGRRGWMVDEVFSALDASETFAGTLLHLADAADETLWRLTEAAAFCVYPSRTEGFGLPVVEAMARGKAIAVSSGGALPEASRGCAPCLDPDDDDAWFEQIRGWIEHPEALAEAEALVRRDFSYSSWDEVAARMFAVAGFTRRDAAA